MTEYSDTDLTSTAFTRRSRLLTPADFQRVFAKGRRCNSQHLQLIVRQRAASENAADRAITPAPATTAARLGLTVAKRVARRAVDRNRIKRIARDSFRRHRQHLSGLDIVLVARAGIADLPRRDLHQALENLWRRAKTLKPTPSPVKLAPPDASGFADSLDTSTVTTATRDPST
ncbi:MAG: ribonuclease P protein component [Xanthomonadales bacterium]|nr:ribonuclease P protein component [Xanthomonadales bacterium]